MFIIAEIGSNFDGSLKRAKMLARKAKESGADAFKIQNFLAPKIVSEKGFKNLRVAFQSKWKKPVVEVYKSAEFPRSWVSVLKRYCDSIGIEFMSSPYDFEAVDLLEKNNITVYKIGSGEIDNLPFLRYIAKKGKPVILGCGAANVKEIERAVGAIREVGNEKIILLQCVTNYPSPIADSNVLAMQALAKRFKLIVGYSDHTIGREGGGDDPLLGKTIPLAAVALGGLMIEKHFTDDVKRKGPDHSFAMEYDNFKLMVDSIRALEKGLGDGVKRIMPSEKKTAIIQRRGIYAKFPIKKGQKLLISHIEYLRPATFLRPADLNSILGKKAVRDISTGDALRRSFFR